MNTVIVPTTLMCQGCVEGLRAVMEATPAVSNWHVDLSQPVKILTASGDNLTEADVIALLQKAGYDVLPEKATTTLPPITG